MGDSDRFASRDITVVIELPDRLHKDRLFSVGDFRGVETLSKKFSGFSRDIRQAWVLAGEPLLSDETISNAVGRLHTGATPDGGERF